MKQILQAVVDFLHGKKAIIGGLVSVISTFLLSQGVITANEAILITGLLSVLGISADVATVKLGVSPDRTMGAKPNVPSDVAASDQK